MVNEADIAAFAEQGMLGAIIIAMCFVIARLLVEIHRQQQRIVELERAWDRPWVLSGAPLMLSTLTMSDDERAFLKPMMIDDAVAIDAEAEKARIANSFSMVARVDNSDLNELLAEAAKVR